MNREYQQQIEYGHFMAKRIIHFLIVFFSLLSTTGILAQSMDAIRNAQSLILEAKKAADIGDYLVAIEKYRKANDIVPSPDNLYAIAILEERIEGGCKDAIQTWQRFIQECTDCILRDKGKKKYDVLKKNCSVDVVIDSNPQGANIYLDQQLVGITPLYKTLIAGKYELMIQYPEYERYLEEIIFLKGESNKTKIISLEKKSSGFINPIEDKKEEVLMQNQRPVIADPLQQIALIFGTGKLNENPDDSKSERSRINAGFSFQRDFEKKRAISGFGVFIDHHFDQYKKDNPPQIENNLSTSIANNNEQNTTQGSFWVKIPMLKHSLELGASAKFFKIVNRTQTFSSTANAMTIEKKENLERNGFYAFPVFKLNLNVYDGLIVEIGQGKPFHPMRDQGLFFGLRYGFGDKPTLSKTWVKFGFAQTARNAGLLLNSFIDELKGGSNFYPYLGFSILAAQTLVIELNAQSNLDFSGANALAQLAYVF
jgi:hypothetical protein